MPGSIYVLINKWVPTWTLASSVVRMQGDVRKVGAQFSQTGLDLFFCRILSPYHRVAFMPDFWVAAINRISSCFPSVLSLKHQGEIQRLAETSWVIGKITVFWELPLFSALHWVLSPRLELSASHHPWPPAHACSRTRCGTYAQPCLSSQNKRRGWRTGFLFSFFLSSFLSFFELFPCSLEWELPMMTRNFMKRWRLTQQQTTN